MILTEENGTLVVAPAICSRGWSKRCAAAKSERCRCRCAGENHGMAHERQQEPEPSRQHEPSLFDFATT